MSKKRTKKHNPLKAAQITAEATVKNLMLLMSLSITEGSVVCYNTVKRKRVVVDKKLFKVLDHCNFMWQLVLVVQSKESNGKNRTSIKYVKAPFPCKHIELIASLDEHHNEMINIEKAKNNDVYNASWAAIPSSTSNHIIDAEDSFIQSVVEILENF